MKRCLRIYFSFRENDPRRKINSDSSRSITERILLSFQFFEDSSFQKWHIPESSPEIMILRFLLPRRNLTDRFLKRPPKRDNNGYLWNAWMEIGHPMSSTRNIAQYSGKGTKKQSTLISKENFREFHDHHSEKNDKKFEMRIANLRLWTERESWNDTSFIWTPLNSQLFHGDFAR